MINDGKFVENITRVELDDYSLVQYKNNVIKYSFIVFQLNYHFKFAVEMTSFILSSHLIVHGLILKCMRRMLRIRRNEL